MNQFTGFYLLLGIIFIFAGWIYMYKINLVFKINQFVKNHFFNDGLIMTEHRKIGLFLLFLAAIFLYMGFSKIEVGSFEKPAAQKKVFRLNK